MSRVRRVSAVLVLALVACSAPPPAWCAAWDADACVAVPLVPLDSPACPGVASALVLTVDARGHALAAVAGSAGVTVLEEREDGLHALGWPEGLDTYVDMPALAAGAGAVAAVAVRASPDGANGDVLLARRLGDGSWITPTRRETLSAPPRAYEPRVAFDASGALLLVTNQGAAARVGYGVAVSIAPSVEAPFARPRDADDVLSAPLFYSNSPRPALDGQGRAIVTWYQSLGGVLRVFFAERPDASSPFVPADVARALSVEGTPIDSSGAPDPACNAAGVCAVAWGQDDGRGGVAVYLATRAAGAAFVGPASLADALSLGDGVARDVRTRVAGDGTVLVAWSERIGAREHVFLARVVGDARDVRLVSDAARDAYAPALATSADGAVALAFVEREGTSSQVVLLRAATDLSLAEPERLGSNDVASPALAFSPSGERIVLGWIEGGQPRLAAR